MTVKTSVPVPATVEDYLAQSNPDVLRAMVKIFAEQLRANSSAPSTTGPIVSGGSGADRQHGTIMPSVALASQ